MLKHNTASTLHLKCMLIFLFSLRFNCLFSFYWTCTVHWLCSGFHWLQWLDWSSAMTSQILLRVCSDYPVTNNDWATTLWLNSAILQYPLSVLLIILSAGVNNTKPKDASSSLKTPEMASKIKCCVLFRMIQFFRNDYQSPIWNAFLMINTAV